MSSENSDYSRGLTAAYISNDNAHSGTMERYDTPSITRGPPLLIDGAPQAVPQHNSGTAMSFRYDEGALSLDESVMFFDLVFQAGMNDQKMKALLTFVRAL